MKLRLNQPVDTREPILDVTGLKVPGKYRFRLVVTDDQGRASQPTHFVVEVIPGPTRVAP